MIGLHLLPLQVGEEIANIGGKFETAARSWNHSVFLDVAVFSQQPRGGPDPPTML